MAAICHPFAVGEGSTKRVAGRRMASRCSFAPLNPWTRRARGESFVLEDLGRHVAWLWVTQGTGTAIFWSGAVNDGNGPVEKGAHFYKSLQVDGNGNVIDKRNAWSTRSVVYVKLIPPGAADTVHYRLQIPETAGDHITLKAKLNYRKFQWINTQFAFAGEPDPHSPDPRVTADFDNRHFTYTADTSTVWAKSSGRI